MAERTRKNNGSSASSPLAPVLIIVAVGLVYARILNNPATFDTAQFLHPPYLRHLYADTPWWTHRALPLYTFVWIQNLFGENLFWQNLANLLLHLGNVTLVYSVFARLFAAALPGDKRIKDTPLKTGALAAAGALFFGLHPCATYAAAYLVQRYTLMSAFFALLAFSEFLNGLLTKKRTHYFLSAVFYLLAVRCKENVVLLPVLFALALPLVRRPLPAPRELLAEFGPLFAACLAVALQVTFEASGILGKVYEDTAGATVKLGLEKGFIAPLHSLYGLSVVTQGYDFFRYLLLWLIPDLSRMAIDVPLEFADSYFAWPHAFGFACYLALPFFALPSLFKGGTRALCAFAFLSAWALFGTEFSTARITEQFVIYRSYWWMIGLPALAPALAAFLPRERGKAFAVVAVGLVLLAGLCTERLATFDSDHALWHDAYRKLPTDKILRSKGFRIAYNLGFALQKIMKFPEAETLYRETLSLNPGYPWAKLNLGVIKMGYNDFDGAEKIFREVLTLEPGPFVETAHVNLGVIALNRRAPERAIEHLRLVDPLSQYYSPAQNNLGLALQSLGKNAEASEAFEAAIAADPTNVNPKLGLGALLLESGNRHLPRVRELSENVLRLAPGNADAHVHLGEADLREKRAQEAQGHFEAALRERRRHHKALVGVTVALALQGKSRQAVEAARRAVSLKPELAGEPHIAAILEAAKGNP